jgi:predicted benzoate:H+ symporter BenE
MALIECPDCKRQISDAATACLGCGRPVAVAPPTTEIAATRDVQLIEKHAKSYKAGMLCGFALVIGGFFSAIVFGGEFALFVMVCGVILFLWNVMAAWWNHG